MNKIKNEETRFLTQISGLTKHAHWTLGILRHLRQAFSGFEFSLLLNRVHACAELVKAPAHLRPEGA